MKYKYILQNILYKLDMYKISYLIFIIQCKKMFKYLIKESQVTKYLSGKGKKND